MSEVNFNYQGVHHCEAVAVACIDFRFQAETRDFLAQELGLKSFDYAGIPGAVKALNEDDAFAWSCIAVPYDLHAVRKVILINHTDCGAYGGSSKFANGDEEETFHKAELEKAKTKILEKYSDMEVVMVYAKLVDEGKKISFFII